MRQAELARRLGVHENRLHRLVERGVIRSVVDSQHRKGGVVEYNQGECRAAATIVGALGSPFFGGPGGAGGNKSDRTGRMWEVLSQIADVAARPLPTSGPVPRWIIVQEDGSCVRGGDWLAFHTQGPRTLVPLVDVP